ncbi:hypothetical protein [Acetobacterium wieringae]|uniref:hypothetical protein n=1 Tax=Acetobacterium wieringae TaxID=52694 RepID=UPI00315947EF
MKKYRLEFEDQEFGLRVPVIIDTNGKDFWDAVDQVRDEINLADRAKDEGYPVYEEIKKHSLKKGLQ